MKKKSLPATNIGSVSLLMIFIVLSLATFATLSLSSAANDYRYSQKIAAHNTAYYEACSKASLQLKDIDNVLANAYNKDSDHYHEEALALLSDIDGMTVDEKDTIPVLTFHTQVNDTHTLKVVLTLNEPNTLSDGFYRITTWQEISTASWKGNDRLNLIE